MEKKIFAKARMRNYILSHFKGIVCKHNPNIIHIRTSSTGTSRDFNFYDLQCRRCDWRNSMKKQTCLSWSKLMSARSYLKDSHSECQVLWYQARSNFSTTTIKLEKDKEKKDDNSEKKSDENNEKERSKEEEEEEKKKEAIAQEIAAKNANDPLFFFAIVFALVSLAVTRDYSLMEYSYSGTVSKNEFDNMIAGGKVRKIVKHPQGVRVYLYDSYAGKTVTVPSGCWVLFQEPFSQVVPYVRRATEGNPNVKNDVIFDEGRKHLTMLLPMLIIGFAYFLAFKRTIRIITAAENAKFSKQNGKSTKQDTTAFKSDVKPESFKSRAQFDESFNNQVKTHNEKQIKFKDIAGIKEAKVEVMEFVDYLKNPLRYQRLGAKIPHGALLLGPPGCGKTLLAKAVAAEAGVPFFYRAGSQFVEIFGGKGASRVRELFKTARARAPCIIFIDELDAIGRVRGGKGGRGNTEEDQTLNQLLVEMDGINTTEGVIVLGATNRVDILDKALLRPGRLDRHILIDLPTSEERVELFEMYLSKIKIDFSISVFAPRLAQLTPGMSGADIANVCNEAAIYAATNNKDQVTMADMDYALQRIIGGPEKRSFVRDAREKKINAYYEAGRAVVSWLTRTSDAILKISIVPRSKYRLGHYQYYKPERDLQTNVQLFEKMLVHLAGSATEALVFKHHSTGIIKVDIPGNFAAEKDLDIVKKLAYLQVREFGMNENVGQISFHFEEGDETLPKPYSKYMENMIDTEARNLVTKASVQSKKILEENMEKVHKVAKALMERETLSYEDIEKLIGPPPHGNKMPDDYANLTHVEAAAGGSTE